MAKLDSDVYWDKLKQREAVLKESIAYWLKLEQKINDAHTVRTGQRLTQGDFFE